MTNLRASAWATVFAHLLGLGFAAFGMRPGTPLRPLAERMAYLAASPFGWTWGWFVWIVCALTLAVFFALLTRKLPPSARRGARICVVFAVAADLVCDASQMVVLPWYARGDASHFLVVERALGLGGTLVANTLYTLAVLVVTLALKGSWPRRLGVATCMAGLSLSIGGALDMPQLIEISTGPTMLFYCAWVLAASSEVA